MEGAEIKEVGVHVQLESKGCSFPGFMCCLPGEGEKSYLLGIRPRLQRLINHVQKGGCLARTRRTEDSKHPPSLRVQQCLLGFRQGFLRRQLAVVSSQWFQQYRGHLALC